MRILSTIIIAMSLGLVPATARDLTSMKEIFEEKSTEIDDTLSDAREKAQLVYAEMLNDALALTKMRNDYDQYVALKAEVERFEREKTVSDNSDGKIGETALAYATKMEEAQKERDIATGRLMRQYVSALNTYYRKLHAARKHAEAKEVEREMTRVKPMLAVIEAKYRGKGGSVRNGTRKTYTARATLPPMKVEEREWVKTLLKIKKGDIVTVKTAVHVRGEQVNMKIGDNFSAQPIIKLPPNDTHTFTAQKDGNAFFWLPGYRHPKESRWTAATVELKVERSE